MRAYEIDGWLDKKLHSPSEMTEGEYVFRNSIGMWWWDGGSEFNATETLINSNDWVVFKEPKKQIEFVYYEHVWTDIDGVLCDKKSNLKWNAFLQISTLGIYKHIETITHKCMVDEN